MHGMTKFVEYMMLYGSAMNYYGGPGEANHKIFVKAAGQKTQHRVCEFAQQTVHQYCQETSERDTANKRSLELCASILLTF
jgi:hypothetical protein